MSATLPTSGPNPPLQEWVVNLWVERKRPGGGYWRGLLDVTVNAATQRQALDSAAEVARRLLNSEATIGFNGAAAQS